MNIGQIITQLRTYAPMFDGNVAGAARYMQGISDQVWLPMPAAYVIPDDIDAAGNTDLSGYNGIVDRRISVIVVLDNATLVADRRGQQTAEQLDQVEAAVHAAILNWRPDFNYALDPEMPSPANTAARGFQFVGGGVEDMDRSRLRYRFTYLLQTTLSQLDGWQPPTEPFTQIELDATATAGIATTETVEAVVNLPQE